MSEFTAKSALGDEQPSWAKHLSFCSRSICRNFSVHFYQVAQIYEPGNSMEVLDQQQINGFQQTKSAKDFKLTKTIWQTKPNHLINMNSKISSSSSRNLWYQDTVEHRLCARICVLCPDTLCARICAQIWLCAQICVVRTYFQRGMDCNALRGMSSKKSSPFLEELYFLLEI